jgi:hypothetical protein
VQVEIDQQHRIREQQRQGEKRNAQRRIAKPPWIAESLGDPPVGVVFEHLDRHLEHGLRQGVEQHRAEQPDEDARHQVAADEVRGRPDEVHDDAQVGELDREPDVRPPGEDLKPAAAPLRKIQDRRIDECHGARVSPIDGLRHREVTKVPARAGVEVTSATCITDGTRRD